MARDTQVRRGDDVVEDEQSALGRIKLVVGLVALGALVLFFFQNLQEVEVHFLWFDWSTRMLWALFASGIIGALAAVSFGTLRRRRSREP